MKLIYLTGLFLILTTIVEAQTSDFGIWTSLGATKKIKKWEFTAEAILRTQNGVQDLKRWGLKAEISRRMIKPVTLGVSYQYITFNDLKYSDMQPRQRYAVFISGKQHLGDFSISLREQVQRTVKDESDRLKSNGEYDTYKINPEFIWRNKIQLGYNIPHFPINPSCAVETFYQLNNPDGNVFCDLRYTLALDYNFTKHQQIRLYGLIDKEINVNNPVRSNVLGIDYSFSF